MATHQHMPLCRCRGAHRSPGSPHAARLQQTLATSAGRKTKLKKPFPVLKAQSKNCNLTSYCGGLALAMIHKQSAPWCLYTFMAYAAAMAMLLSRQKPWEPCGSLAQVTTPVGPAWCPGGRTAQNAFLACRCGGMPKSQFPFGRTARHRCMCAWLNVLEPTGAPGRSVLSYALSKSSGRTWHVQYS